MKGVKVKKLLSILFAVVLVASFSLVTATPVMAITPYYVATIGSDDYGDGTETWVDNDPPGWGPEDTGPWLTIQHAIDQCTGGEIINVAPGTYDEQVVINEMLTLTGVGDDTIVKPSSATVLSQNFKIPWYTGTKKVAGIIVATGGNVTVKNLKVDGVEVTSCPSGVPWVAGILYRETGGLIDNVTVTNMTIGPTGTAVRGQGILLSAISNYVHVEVKDCSISNYDKNGITAIGNQLTTTIHDNI